MLVAESLEARHSECQDAMLNALASLSHGSLEDFDWQAKVGLSRCTGHASVPPLVHCFGEGGVCVCVCRWQWLATVWGVFRSSL